MNFVPTGPIRFSRALDAARLFMEYRDSLQVSPVTEHQPGMAYFLTEDTTAGFALDYDGTLVHLFKHPESTHKDVMREALTVAKERGATRLEAFDTYLVRAYERRGARIVERHPFDASHAPRGWNVDSMGAPDYVEMSLLPLEDGENVANIQNGRLQDCGAKSVASLAGVGAS